MRKNLKNLFSKIANNTSLSQKYIFANVFIILIPCVILAGAYFYRFQSIVQREITSSFEQVMEQYVSSVIYKLNLYHNIEKTFSINSVVQEILKEEKAQSPMEIMSLVERFYAETRSIFLGDRQDEVYNIMLYSFNKKLDFDGEFLKSIKYVQDEVWYKEIMKTNNFYNCFYNTKSTDKKNLIMLFQPIVRTNVAEFEKPLGIIQISLYAERIFKPESGMAREERMEVVVLDNKGNLVYGDKVNAEILKDMQKNNKNSDVIKSEKNHKILIHKYLSPYHLEAIAFFSYNEVTDRMSALANFNFIVVGIILFVSLSLTILFSRIFTKRIHVLIGKMKKAEEGDLNISSVIEGEDEVGLLDRQFNSMTFRLKSVISENYIQRLEKREAELNALQLQINPHFLYNTLESISAIAAINNCFDICTICQKLGDMFRYNINSIKNEFVFLRDEINHIKNYIYIQEIRFEGRFTMEYEIPEDLMKCRILKFILQPVIENALHHGLEAKMGKGIIIISAKICKNTLHLSVKDNGVGMPQDKLAKLNESFTQKDIITEERVKRSIGLKNVDARIKMINGSIYGITINSMLNIGTEVVITLPILRGNREDADV